MDYPGLKDNKIIFSMEIGCIGNAILIDEKMENSQARIKIF